MLRKYGVDNSSINVEATLVELHCHYTGMSKYHFVHHKSRTNWVKNEPYIFATNRLRYCTMATAVWN
jgi:hypothetical protein